eukprot:CAMPEP_0197514834 /NCGR_PEP_ID=MMETSP1318-20131121/154_1 /TAXON_ID=552666 /ORGANISM="Partenskyella glossopodia, Strain RCC365" /LENGTH=265 /DNA_ID=CAMNT_0043063037 /DNA_START=60 /DNA_END=857 /DNA_ORIENTATION=-
MFTPVNQVRLTNVAIVRYKKKGKRFEIACYKNKVVSWRNKVEKDIDEVLQSHNVFTNVSKGTLAKSKDLERCFGIADQTECCKIILEKGQLQVSQKERKVQSENMLRDIATIIADKCINIDTKLPFPVATIQSAMKEVKFSLKPNRSAKQQAMDLIPHLEKELPIARAQMRVRIILPERQAKEVKKSLVKVVGTVENEDWDFGYEMTARIDPGSYRGIVELVAAGTKGKGSVDILDCKVQGTTISSTSSGGIEDDLKQKTNNLRI